MINSFQQQPSSFHFNLRFFAVKLIVIQNTILQKFTYHLELRWKLLIKIFKFLTQLRNIVHRWKINHLSGYSEDNENRQSSFNDFIWNAVVVFPSIFPCTQQHFQLIEILNSPKIPLDHINLTFLPVCSVFLDGCFSTKLRVFP